MKIIFLCGFMGCGKTYIGKLVAEKLGYLFLDLDEQVEKTSGRTVADIFAADGEQAFRGLETITLAVTCESARRSGASHVVALGGGAIAGEVNVKTINQYGTSIFIDTDFETCYARIKDDPNRPLVNERGTLERFFEKRREIYMCNAKFTVNGNDELADIVTAIIGIHTTVDS
jgi:shikimate kinase